MIGDHPDPDEDESEGAYELSHTLFRQRWFHRLETAASLLCGLRLLQLEWGGVGGSLNWRRRGRILHVQFFQAHPGFGTDGAVRLSAGKVLEIGSRIIGLVLGFEQTAQSKLGLGSDVLSGIPL